MRSSAGTTKKILGNAEVNLDETQYCRSTRCSEKLEKAGTVDFNNTPHGRWGQGPGNVDPRFPAGLPFPRCSVCLTNYHQCKLLEQRQSYILHESKGISVAKAHTVF